MNGLSIFEVLDGVSQVVSGTRQLKLSASMTSHAYLLDIKGPFTQGLRPVRTIGELVGGIPKMDSSDWSNGVQ